MSFAHDFSQLRELHPNNLPEAVSHLERKPLAQVTLWDLYKCPTTPHGIYLIFGPPPTRECYYIGKAEARSFIERVPCHIDAREGAWMNTLPKKIRAEDKGLTLAAAVDIALACSISFLCMDKKSLEKVSRLEAALRYLLKPKYNTLIRRPKWLDEGGPLSAILDGS